MGDKTISNLRKLRDTAIADAARREAEERERRERERQDLARTTIASIRARAETQAALGKSFAYVMKVEFEGAPLVVDGTYSIDPEQLRGASLDVWQHCIQEGYAPALVAGFEPSDRYPAHQLVFRIQIRW